MQQAKFTIGQCIHHKLFDYRGVIVDVDPVFQGTGEWYDAVARSRPPKDKPWYYVLVDDSDHETYVAEQNLSADVTDDPVRHPLIDVFFDRFDKGHYFSDRQVN
jgi:heat shock protein HspQ